MRDVKRRNYLRAVDGDGGDHKALGDVPFRSLLERDLRTLLGANPAIAHYAIEPHELEFFLDDGKGGFEKHLYTPDVVCRYRTGEIVVIDAKAAFFASLPAWSRKEAAIREGYDLDYGVAFVVLSEPEIRAQPRLSNCQVLERHRYITRDDGALVRVRGVLAELPRPVTVAQVVRAAALNDQPGECKAYTALMNLALSGEIRLDLAAPFSFAMQIWDGDDV